jgi:two-component system response regulator FixJ
MPPAPLEPAIHVIDDEAPFRRSLIFLLESTGWTAIGHDSAESFLDAEPAMPPTGGCLVLDIRMKGMSGLELQRRLASRSSPWPIVFISGHADAEMVAQAMSASTVAFLRKPFKDDVLLDAVEHAVAASLPSVRSVGSKPATTAEMVNAEV